MKKALFCLIILLLPLTSFGATPKLQFSAWVPYWKKTAAMPEATAHLNQLNSISPFSYEVKADGVLKDPMKIDKEPWVSMLASARAQKIKIIPSILWNDGKAIQKVMATKKNRDAHIKQIIDTVNAKNYDGIDIDYENKTTAVFKTFGLFLRDLSAGLHKNKKVLVCTIEPRLPPSSRFLPIPEEIEYSNDYKMINTYCDEVRLMAYDQMTADILLNRRNKSTGLYAPVSDISFVKKVVAYSHQQIAYNKIVIGVANYGYAYQVIDKGTFYDYKKLSALTYKTFNDLAASVGATPKRNIAGELSFTYVKEGQSRYAVLSDSVAIATKVKLARNLGLKGIALFKVDGESDPNIWTVLK